MKAITLLTGLLTAMSLPLMADNVTTTVSQVTTNVTLANDVDYHITSTTPFTTTGSIDITNTDHAVVIFDNLQPSEVSGGQLAFVKINGAKATNGGNCQVRIYGDGAMILPYGNATKPLTTYTEADFQGESCNDYDLSSTGGYMNTLTDAQLNNRIVSFKLKRGYMVTFSLRANGRGYSRCFVAANADLEMNLPALMKNRVSSYRVFKWNDVSKKGLASDLDNGRMTALKASWGYIFGVPGDGGANYETVAFKVHEGWPGTSDCGSSGSSPYLKTNNEPANQSDDNPATVDQVLANWESYMATGKILCSPSPHDGGESWLRNFMDSIDRRGWRCDIIDVHSYWYADASSWNSWMSSKGYRSYGRPIWISEGLYGASWSSNWYANNDNSSNWASQYQTNLNHMKGVLEWISGDDQVARFAYWNGEKRGSRVVNTSDASLKDKNYLTPLGEYYASWKPGRAYSGKYIKVPNAPRLESPVITEYEFKPRTSQFTLYYTDANGELTDSLYLERQLNGGAWKVLERRGGSESTSSIRYIDTVTTAGSYTYRVRLQMYNGTRKLSNEVYNVIAGSTGSETLQYGSLGQSSSDESFSYFANSFDESPSIVFGSPTNNNPDLAPVEHVTTVTRTGGVYAFFGFNYQPWTVGDGQTFSTEETSNYIVAAMGNGSIGGLAYEAGTAHNDEGREIAVGGDTVTVKFNQPFTTTPVVLATPRYTTTGNTRPVMWRVFDVTPESFRLVSEMQKGLNITPSRVRYSYFAIEPGTGNDGLGKTFTVGTTNMKFTSTAARAMTFSETAVSNPKMMAQLQTNNRNVAALVRINEKGLTGTSARIRVQTDTSDKDATVNARNPLEETIGYIVISDDTTYVDGIEQVTVNPAEGKVSVYPAIATTAVGVCDADATTAALFSANGQKLDERPLIDGQTTFNVSGLAKGVYIIRTNALHATKFVKR